MFMTIAFAGVSHSTPYKPTLKHLSAPFTVTENPKMLEAVIVVKIFDWVCCNSPEFLIASISSRTGLNKTSDVGCPPYQTPQMILLFLEFRNIVGSSTRSANTGQIDFDGFSDMLIPSVYSKRFKSLSSVS
jgi:hypothetical protein